MAVTLTLSSKGDFTNLYSWVCVPSVSGSYKMDFYIDGALSRTEGVAPYCLFGDNGADATLSKLNKAGSHKVLVKAYQNSVLVATSEERTYTEGTSTSTLTATLSMVGDPLAGPYTVVCSLNLISSSYSVVFKKNGTVVRTEGVAPYCMFGDNGTVDTAIKSTFGPGTYNITADVYYSGVYKLTTAVLTYTEGAPAGTLTFAVDSRGLYSLKWNGSEMLDGPVDSYSEGAYWIDGSFAGNTITSTSYTANSFTKTYSAWGKITHTYSVSGNKFSISTKVENTSTTKSIGTIHLTPLILKGIINAVSLSTVLPNQLHNITEPSVTTMDWGTLRIVACYEDLAQIATFGFPWIANGAYPLRIDTGFTASYSDSYPYINRDIAPGASDTFKSSVRFGTTTDSAGTLASDLYARVGIEVPMKIGVTWTDRRPIGFFVLNDSVNAAPGKTNPRGWFADSTLNLTNPNDPAYPYGALNSAGLTAFQQTMVDKVGYMLTELASLHAQGIILYGPEGQWFAQFQVSYVGDASLTNTLAPEMAATVTYNGTQMPFVDSIFKRFTDAGYKTGLCLNPHKAMTTDGWKGATNSWQEGGTPVFVNGAIVGFQDHDLGYKTTDRRCLDVRAQNLIDKIQYAKTRWGCTMHYLDWNQTQGNDCHILKKVNLAHPDVLILPEYFGRMYAWAYTAPMFIPKKAGQGGHAYDEYGTGVSIKCHPLLTTVYPGAFTVVRVDQDVITSTNRPKLVASVARGDILMCLAGAGDLASSQVRQIYIDAGKG